MGQHIEERMAERRNEERQKLLVADTDRLLALAQQLKAEVDKSSKDQLSIDVVKRAEQIEKLAHSVKEKMRGY
jgi:nitric oxide reductase activation protein